MLVFQGMLPEMRTEAKQQLKLDGAKGDSNEVRRPMEDNSRCLSRHTRCCV